MHSLSSSIDFNGNKISIGQMEKRTEQLCVLRELQMCFELPSQPWLPQAPCPQCLAGFCRMPVATALAPANWLLLHLWQIKLATAGLAGGHGNKFSSSNSWFRFGLACKLKRGQLLFVFLPGKDFYIHLKKIKIATRSWLSLFRWNTPVFHFDCNCAV